MGELLKKGCGMKMEKSGAGVAITADGCG